MSILARHISADPIAASYLYSRAAIALAYWQALQRLRLAFFLGQPRDNEFSVYG